MVSSWVVKPNVLSAWCRWERYKKSNFNSVYFFFTQIFVLPIHPYILLVTHLFSVVYTMYRGVKLDGIYTFFLFWPFLPIFLNLNTASNTLLNHTLPAEENCFTRWNKLFHTCNKLFQQVKQNVSTFYVHSEQTENQQYTHWFVIVFP